MIRCLFGWHKWGIPKNIRDADLGAAALLLIVPMVFLGCHPKECDRYCERCGKKKTFPYEKEL